jgi:ubiquinone/menaquinone biosynthesis C-methylase UbiE
VIGFTHDPDQGVREMMRVTRPGGILGACMRDTASGGMTVLRIFWTAARQIDQAVVAERRMAGTPRATSPTGSGASAWGR